MDELSSGFTPNNNPPKFHVSLLAGAAAGFTVDVALYPLVRFHALFDAGSLPSRVLPCRPPRSTETPTPKLADKLWKPWSTGRSAHLVLVIRRDC